MNIGEKSKKLLLEDVEKTLKTFMSEMGEVPEPLDKEILESTMNSILINNSRSLFSFFDKHEIYLTIIFYNKEYWEYVINTTKFTSSFDTRELAEEAGFEACFKLLEEKL